MHGNIPWGSIWALAVLLTLALGCDSAEGEEPEGDCGAVGSSLLFEDGFDGDLNIGSGGEQSIFFDSFSVYN